MYWVSRPSLVENELSLIRTQMIGSGKSDEPRLSGGTKLPRELAVNLGKPVLHIYDSRKERRSRKRTALLARLPL
jgi:hypothetical protein